MPDKPTARATWTLAHVEIPPKPWILPPPPQVPDRAIENPFKTEHHPMLVSDDRENSVGTAGHSRHEVLSDPVVQRVTDEVLRKMKRKHMTTSSQCPGIGIVDVIGNSSGASKGQDEDDDDDEPIQSALVPQKR
ncbi:hypothetical protein PM082_009816 [Marasmius tenuissimus]|nr:hypothetical protein PM082_009816 [Marasmius tenuissimus]